MNPWAKFAVTFFLGMFGVHKFMDHKIGMGILYFFTGGLFGIGWIIDWVQSLIAAIKGPETQQAGAYQTVHRHTPEAVVGFAPAYSYDDVEIFCPADVIAAAALKAIPAGAPLSFRKEPENEYDSNAVAVYNGDRKIGYLHRNRLQDMANEYMSRGWIIRSAFEMYSVDQTSTISIDFYKPAK